MMPRRCSYGHRSFGGLGESSSHSGSELNAAFRLFADPNASSAATRTMPPRQASGGGKGAEGVRLKGIDSSIAIAKPQHHV